MLTGRSHRQNSLAKLSSSCRSRASYRSRALVNADRIKDVRHLVDPVQLLLTTLF
jgi:hypothetical protein